MKIKEQALAEIKELQVIDKGISTAYFQVGDEECAIQRACIEAKYDYESEEYYFGVRYPVYRIPSTTQSRKRQSHRVLL